MSRTTDLASINSDSSIITDSIVADKLGFTPTNYSAQAVRVSNEGFADAFSAGWSMAYATRTVVESVNTGVGFTSRSASSQELLTAMGRDGQTHLHTNFNIVRLTWGTRSPNGYLLPYQHSQSTYSIPMTVAAFVKHEAGPVPHGWWCHGLEANGGWQWCKSDVGFNKNGYIHTHPYQNGGSSDGGSILVALPAIFAGRLLSPQDHWYGPAMYDG